MRGEDPTRDCAGRKGYDDDFLCLRARRGGIRIGLQYSSTPGLAIEGRKDADLELSGYLVWLESFRRSKSIRTRLDRVHGGSIAE
jgi:hypothetical protein